MGWLNIYLALLGSKPYSLCWRETGNFNGLLSSQFSQSVVSDSLRPHELQHARHPYPSPTLGVHSNSCPSSWWCHPAISSSAVPFSSCPQSFPASESFPMSQPFTWGGQSIGVSALASVLPKNTQDWSPLEWTGWISFQSKGLSRVFSNTTVQKHQFFGAQLSSQSNSHIHTWPPDSFTAINFNIQSLLQNMFVFWGEKCFPLLFCGELGESLRLLKRVI